MTTPVTRRGRLLFFFAAFVAVDAAAAMVACSSSSTDEVGPDATTTEASPSGDAGKDAPVVKPEAGGEGGATCKSPANAQCDIVAQDCAPGKECVVVNGKTTECRAVEATQQLPIGHACCETATSGNPCLPGLTCVGGDSCTDGGPQTGRCSPACCEGDDQHCGKSDPEGIAGECNLTLSSGSTDLYRVCTYSATCKPFKVDPCKGDDICLVKDKLGTASCVSPFMLPAKTNRQPCTFANECEDGLVCLGTGDAGTCHYVCLTPGSNHPFDAGVEEGGPGRGGCPVGEKCDLGVQNRPDWFRVCSLDGG